MNKEEIKKVLEEFMANLPSGEELEKAVEELGLSESCEIWKNPKDALALCEDLLGEEDFVELLLHQLPTGDIPADYQSLMICMGALGASDSERHVDEATKKYLDWFESQGMNTVSAAVSELRKGCLWGLEPSNAAVVIAKQEAYHALRLIHGIATPPMWYRPWDSDWNSNDGPDIRNRFLKFVTLDEVKEDGEKGTKWYLDYALEHWYQLVEEDGKVIEVRFQS